MDSVTTSAQPTKPARLRGFTLTEVMISAGLGAVILAAVLSAFLFLTRTGYRASAYSEMEAHIRRGLETFAQDVRQAQNLQWNSSQSITLYLPTGASASIVNYAYDTNPASATYQSFYRQADSGPRRALVTKVANDFAFHRYKLEQDGVVENVAANDAETKQLQIDLRTVRAYGTSTGATQAMVSSRFILRNKRVSN